MAYRHFARGSYWSLAVLVLFFLTLASLTIIGAAPKKFAPGHTVYKIKQPAKAFFLLRGLGLRKRTLIYFGKNFPLPIDDYPSPSAFNRLDSMRTPPKIAGKHFLYFALATNIVDKIYRVIPDSRWANFKKKLADYPLAYYDGREFTSIVYDTKLINTRLRNVPTSEPAVVYVETKDIRDYGDKQVKDFINNPSIADVVVIRADK